MSAHGLDSSPSLDGVRASAPGDTVVDLPAADPMARLADISRQQAVDARAAAERDGARHPGNAHWQLAQRAFSEGERALAEGRLADAASSFGYAAGSFLRARTTAQDILATAPVTLASPTVPAAATPAPRPRRPAGHLAMAGALVAMVCAATWALHERAPRPRPTVTPLPPVPSPMSMVPRASGADALAIDGESRLPTDDATPPAAAPTAAPAIQPEPPAPTPVALRTPAEPPPAVTDPALRDWLTRYTAAWQARDVVALQRLGALTTPQETPRLDAEIARSGTLRVTVRRLVVRDGGEFTTVSFDREIARDDGTVVSDPLRYRLRQTPAGLVAIGTHEGTDTPGPLAAR